MVGAGDGEITGGIGNWNTTNGNWTTDGGANNIQWDNLGNHVAIFGGTAGAVTLDGPITLGGITFNSVYTIQGPHTLTLAGSNPTIHSNGPATINSAMGGNSGLTKTGAGTLSITAQSTYTGATTIIGGQISANYATQSTNIINSASNLVLEGGVFAALFSGTVTNSQTFAGTTLVSGVNALHVNKGLSGTTTGTLNVGAITRNAGATLNLHLSHSGAANRRIQSSSWALNQTITDNGVAYATFVSGTVTGTNPGPTQSTGTTLRTGNDWASYTGTTAATATVGAATYTNSTATSLSGNATIATGINTTLSADTTITTLRASWAQNRSVTIGEGNILTTGGILIASTATATTTISGGTLRSAATIGGKDLVVISHAGNLLINSSIANAAAGSTGLTKTGVGTLSLAGANTFTGATIVSGGTLRTERAAALATTSSIALSGGSTLTINVGGEDGYDDTQVGTLLGKTTFGPASSLGFDATGSPGSYSGDLNIDANVLKTGSGTVTLGGTNDYTGTTTVSGGILQFARRASLYNGDTSRWTPQNIIVNSNATLAFNVGGAGEFSFGEIENLIGSSTASGGFTNGSRVGIDTSNAGGPVTYAGVLANPNGGANTLGFTKLGEGNLILSGENTYSGPTTVNGGTLTLTGNRTVATAINVISTGVASLDLQADLVLATGNNFIGQGAGGTGIVNQTAGDVTFGAVTVLFFGGGGTASDRNTSAYNLSGGTLGSATSTGVISLGVNSFSDNTFTLSGGEVNLPGGGLHIGRLNRNDVTETTNTFNQTGGVAVFGNVHVGGSNNTAGGSGVDGTLNISGGTFTSAGFGSFAQGMDNHSSVNISGTAVVNLPAFPAVRGTGSTATLTFDGGTLSPTAASTTYIGGLTNAFIKAGGATIDVASGNDITISQALLTDTLSTGGGLTQSGAGVLTLSGESTYTGATVISGGGTLALAASGSIDASSGVALGINGTFDVSAKSASYAVGTLTGSGDVIGALTVSTELAIGNSPGTINFSDSLTLADSAVFNFELIGGTTGVGSADLGNINGLLTIGSGVTLSLGQLGTYTLNDKFTLFSYDTLVGTFDGLDEGTVFSDAGGLWQISYNDIQGTNGGSETNFVTITAIPEPTAVLLGSLGLLALLRRRRG